MLQKLIGQKIVIDTPHSVQYIGKLIEFDAEYVVLEDVDVHDSNHTKTNKEQYLIEAARGVVHNNRKSVYVKQSTIISHSRLEDILVF